MLALFLVNHNKSCRLVTVSSLQAELSAMSRRPRELRMNCLHCRCRAAADRGEMACSASPGSWLEHQGFESKPVSSQSLCSCHSLSGPERDLGDHWSQCDYSIMGSRGSHKNKCFTVKYFEDRTHSMSY